MASDTDVTQQAPQPERAQRGDAAPSSGSAKTSAAYFLQLRIENIRCFGPRQTLDLTAAAGLPARWTVVLGDNGVGKTTLLQCIAQSESVSDQFGSEDDEEDPLQDLWYMRAWDTEFLESSRRYDPTRKALAAIEVLVGTGPNLAAADRTVETIELEVHQSSSPRLGVPMKSAVVTEKDLDSLICYGYGANRRMGAVSLSEQDENDTTASLFSDNVTLLNAGEWLLQADYSALVDSPLQQQARTRRDQLIEVLINLLPDVADIRFVRPTEIGRKPRVEVQVPYGWVSISDLSLGYRALVAWIVDFAYRMFERYPESENPLAEPAIVLVDEIDLHLHPKWQRKLISYLTERFPNTQFIVTAHSPLIVQAATDANIVLLRRDGDHVVIDNDIETIRGWRIDQVLTSDLFGLETARPPEYDAAMKERTKLLSKAKLTKKDEARLKKLEEQIGDLPTGESPQDIEAMDIIRRAAEVLKRKEAGQR